MRLAIINADENLTNILDKIYSLSFLDEDLLLGKLVDRCNAYANEKGVDVEIIHHIKTKADLTLQHSEELTAAYKELIKSLTGTVSKTVKNVEEMKIHSKYQKDSTIFYMKDIDFTFYERKKYLFGIISKTNSWSGEIKKETGTFSSKPFYVYQITMKDKEYLLNMLDELSYGATPYESLEFMIKDRYLL